MDPLEFLARVLVHIPDGGPVTTRYYSCSANRPRGMRGKAARAAADGPMAVGPVPARAAIAPCTLPAPFEIPIPRGRWCSAQTVRP